MAESTSSSVEHGELRERKTRASTETKISAPLDPLMSKMRTDESSTTETEKKTFGRTPDGTGKSLILYSGYMGERRTKRNLE